MHHKKSLWFRLSSVFLALIAAQFLTGCGGGGGSGVNTPVGPSPDGKTAIDGYVSYNAASTVVRAKVAGAGFQPLKGAVVELIAFDEAGNEHVLGKTSTDANGYYRLAEVVNPYGWRNLIIRALAAGFELEGVLPQFLPGSIQHAQTIDSTTGVGARIIRQAARLGQAHKVNLGELYALLPETSLRRLSDAALGTIVSGVIAREQVRKQKLGSVADQLLAYAFDLHTQLQAMIEAGDMTAAEAWEVFARKMALKAQELGVSPDQRKTIDDADQALIYEPGVAEVENAGGSTDELDEAALRRYRERKLRLLDSVYDALAQLNSDQYILQEFKALIETLKAKIEAARTPADLHRIFQSESSLQLRFAEMVVRVLVKAGFTVDMIRECFSADVPTYGFAGIDSTNADTPLRALRASSADPAGVAVGFLQKQEEYLTQLIASVRRVAVAHRLTLSETQYKAIALLIWVGGAENLNFTLPLPPEQTDPTPVPYTMTGTVVKLETPQVLEGQSFKYALQAEAVTYAVDGAEKCLSASPMTIAYLSEKDHITLIKIDANGNRTKTLANLESCVGAGMVEIQGVLAALPWKLDDPMPRLPEATSVAAPNSTPSAPGYADGNSGSGQVTTVPVDPAHPLPWVADPLFVIVQVAVILPPPPPPPMRIDGVAGTLAHVTSDGTRIAGVYVFKAEDETSPCHNAVVRFALCWVQADNWPDFAAWVGKPLKATGTLYQSQNANEPRQFVIEDIALR